MSNIDKLGLRLTAEKAKDNFMPNFMVPTRDVLALLDELEASQSENESLAKTLIERNGEPVEGLVKRVAELEEIATDYGMKFQRAQDALKHQSLLHKTQMEAAEKRIAELEAREVKPVAWMRSANVTSFMSRFTTDEKYAVEQWGDDAVALYPLPVAFIPACFTDERNLMHINERGRETSLIWSKQNSDSGDIKLFRIAAAAGKGE